MYLNLDLLYSINEYFYGVFTFVHHKSHMGDQYYIYRNNKMLVYDRKNTLYQFIDYKNKYSFNFLKNQQEKFYFYFKDPHFDVFDFSYEKEFIPIIG